MTSNNNVSSVLLLIFIGLAIYYLCSCKNEPFEDLLSSNNAPDLSNNAYVSSNNLDDLSNAAILSNAPVLSNNIINDVINSQPTTFEPKQMQPPQNSSQEPSFDFDANDEMNNDAGTDLTSAFMAPLAPGTNPEVVDFKKVNNDNYNAKDFLPKQINDQWFETDFSLAKYQLNDDKLINTERYMIGINTVGQSLKNATYDIRGTIANPKLVVSPGNNSTYEPDFNLKPLC